MTLHESTSTITRTTVRYINIKETQINEYEDNFISSKTIPYWSIHCDIYNTKEVRIKITWILTDKTKENIK